MPDFNRYINEMEDKKRKGNFRTFRLMPNTIHTNLSTNDYMGISFREDLRKDFHKIWDGSHFPYSAISSRLQTGNNVLAQTLENELALAYNTHGALVVSSGYHANTGILPALTSKKDLILADKLVHASLIDGFKLCDAMVMRYRHQDYEHLENLLIQYRKDYEYVFIVSESIFSMDGDVVDLETLVEFRKKYDTFLYLDEAHAVGVRGFRGLGIAEEKGLIDQVDFLVGTFGKSYASQGAFLVCQPLIRDYLINSMRTLLYSTALPPIIMAWSSFIFQEAQTMTSEREKLQNLTDLLVDEAESAGIYLTTQSHIVPLILGENNKAIAISDFLIDKGFFVLPIRHPTVPEGTARIRISLSANLTELKILDLVKYLKEFFQRF